MRDRMDKTRVQALWPTLAVCGGFFVGAILGCLFAAVVNGGSARELGAYLSDYVSLKQIGAVRPTASGALWSQGRWLLLCILLGSTGIVSVAIPALFALRGFFFAFGISCFIRFLGVAGFIAAGVVFGLPALFWGPGLFLCGLTRFASVPQSKLFETAGMSLLWRSRRAGVVLGMLFVLISACVECCLLPVLLPLAVRILG